jgi:hypothetical protein
VAIPIEQQIPAYGATIEALSSACIDKARLLSCLKAHHVKTEPVESPQIPAADVIPTLRKAKVNLPEQFYRAMSAELGISFLDSSKIKKIYRSEQKSQLISIIPYPVVSKYKIIPLEIKESYLEVAIDNPLDRRVMMTLKVLLAPEK